MTLVAGSQQFPVSGLLPPAPSRLQYRTHRYSGPVGNLRHGLGLTPRAHSSGGKERQRGISKQGDGYIRRLLVVGATAVIRFARPENPGRQWASALLARKPARVVSVALANKTARMAWALLVRNESYRPRVA